MDYDSEQRLLDAICNEHCAAWGVSSLPPWVMSSMPCGCVTVEFKTHRGNFFASGERFRLIVELEIAGDRGAFPGFDYEKLCQAIWEGR
jgi:hypothetical protein